MKQHVLILCGGKSDEHEISLISAKHIIKALDRKLFEPIVVGIAKDGTWFLEDEKSLCWGGPKADSIRLNTQVPTASLTPFRRSNDKGELIAEGKSYFFDVVFPVLHGPFGEDGTMQGLFDIVGVPYVGANCESSAVCMDKELTKTLCHTHNIPGASFVTIRRKEDLENYKKEITKLGMPVFVKPARLGSSVGISKVEKAQDLRSTVALAMKHDSKVLIEAGIDGREIECAVLGLRNSARVALPGEIIPNPRIGFYSYEGKYLLEDGAQLLAPANLSDEDISRIQDFALKIFSVLECDGMARIDLFMEKAGGRLLLNEANTIPGFTPISMYPKLWQVSGLAYKDLVSELIRLAFLRKS